MDTPTPDEARARSALLTARYPGPDGDAELSELLADSAELVASLTCRLIAPANEGEEVPPGKIRTATRAVVMKAERMASALGERAQTAKQREDAIADLRLRSISAGPWSETYFDLDAAKRGKMLDPDQALHDVLWALATDDCRAAWLALWNQTQVPAAAAKTFDYTRQGGRYRGY